MHIVSSPTQGRSMCKSSTVKHTMPKYISGSQATIRPAEMGELKSGMQCLAKRLMREAEMGGAEMGGAQNRANGTDMIEKDTGKRIW